MKTAKTLAGGNAYNPYPSSTVAPFSSQTNQALQQTQNLANAGNPLAQPSQDAIQGMLGGGKWNDLYNNSGNPAFYNELQRGAGILTDDLMRPYSVTGRFGSAAMNNDIGQQVGNYLQSGIANNWNQNIANQSGILGQMYGNQLSAAGMAPDVYSSSFLPSQYLGQVGQSYDTQNQAQLSDTVARQQQTDMAPWQRLAAANAIQTGSGALGGTASGTMYQPRNFLAPLGGAALGAQAGGSMSGLLGPNAAGIGGLAGLFAGMLGGY